MEKEVVVYEKEGKGKFGQIWASLDKFGQVRTSKKLEKWGKEAERRRKGKKFSGNRGGGESRV